MTDRAWSGDRIRHLEFLGISELESPHLQKKSIMTTSTSKIAGEVNDRMSRAHALGGN